MPKPILCFCGKCKLCREREYQRRRHIAERGYAMTFTEWAARRAAQGYPAR